MKAILFYFKIELFKVAKRKQQFNLLLITSIAYPILISFFIKISFEELMTSSQTPFEDTIATVILLTNSILLLPLWITIFISQEFQNNYVARFSFLNSKKIYFVSKLAYCLLASTYFSFLTFFTSYISFFMLNEVISINQFFFLKLLPQAWLIYLLYSLLSLSVVFLVRKPTASTILMYLLPQLDNIIFIITSKFFEFQVPLGPFELIRRLYSKSIAGFTASYSNPIFNDSFFVILTISYVLIIVTLVYRDFLRRDLNVISE